MSSGCPTLMMVMAMTVRQGTSISRVGDETPPTQPDRVTVEPATDGVEVMAVTPDGQPLTVLIPWDQAVEVSRRILQLARNRGDVGVTVGACGDRGAGRRGGTTSRSRAAVAAVVLCLTACGTSYQSTPTKAPTPAPTPNVRAVAAQAYLAAADADNPRNVCPVQTPQANVAAENAATRACMAAYVKQDKTFQAACSRLPFRLG